MRETAYAKLNLVLHVRARAADGYHDIETVFAFCEAGDGLEATPADVVELEVGGAFASALAGEQDNLVTGAAKALRTYYGECGRPPAPRQEAAGRGGAGRRLGRCSGDAAASGALVAFAG